MLTKIITLCYKNTILTEKRYGSNLCLQARGFWITSEYKRHLSVEFWCVDLTQCGWPCVLGSLVSNDSISDLLQHVWISAERWPCSFVLNQILTHIYVWNGFPILAVRDAFLSKKCSFFEHCSKGLCPPPPPLLFEHLSYFAGGIFWTRFWAFDIMYLFYPQISPSMPQM